MKENPEAVALITIGIYLYNLEGLKVTYFLLLFQYKSGQLNGLFCSSSILPSANVLSSTDNCMRFVSIWDG